MYGRRIALWAGTLVGTALAIASCSGGSLPLTQRIVSPPGSYVSVAQDPTNNVRTGTQTIQQVATTDRQDLTAIRSCGWVAGEYRYWEGGVPSRISGNDWTIRVNQFSRPQGARCFQSFIKTQLQVSSRETRSTVAALPGSLELSESNPAITGVEILYRTGSYWVQIGAAGPHVTKTLVERIARDQGKLLR